MLDFSRIDLLSSYNIANENMRYYKYYMSKKFVFFVLLNLLITNPSKANLDLGIDWSVLEGNAKITNVEWSILKDLQITLYEPSARNLSDASCTVFYIPEDNKPIGGDTGLYRAGIAQVKVTLPNSYKIKPLKNFKIVCK